MANVTIGALTKQATIINNEDNLIMYNATDGTQKITGTTLLDFIQNNLFYNAPSKSSLDENDFFLIRVQDSITGNIVYKKLPFSTVLSSVNLIDLVNQYLDENPPDIKVSIEPQSYLGAGIEITEDQDLNDYIQVGRYYNLGTEVDNIPSDIITPTEFNMIVEQFGDSLLRQTIRCYNDYTPYIRNISWTESEQTIWSQFDGESFDEEQQYYEQINNSNIYRNVVFDRQNYYEDNINFSEYNPSIINQTNFYVSEFLITFANSMILFDWGASGHEDLQGLTSDILYGNNEISIMMSGQDKTNINFEPFKDTFTFDKYGHSYDDILIVYSQEEEKFFFMENHDTQGIESLNIIATIYFEFPDNEDTTTPLRIHYHINNNNPLSQTFSEVPLNGFIISFIDNNQNIEMESCSSQTLANSESNWNLLSPHAFVNDYPVYKKTEDESPQEGKTYYTHSIETTKTYNYGDWKKMPVVEQQESNS